MSKKILNSRIKARKFEILRPQILSRGWRSPLEYISLEVAKRMLDVLYESGKVNRTNLATKTRLNYNVCLKYIKTLKELGWLTGSDNFSITKLGREERDRLAAAFDAGRSRQVAMTSCSEISELSTEWPTAAPIQHDGYDENYEVNRKIMIVDDEPDILLTYKSFLIGTNIDVLPFSDSLDALREFTSRPSSYDLIILDIRMGQLNGLQLYQSMKAINPSCKIVFLSGLDAVKEISSIIPGISTEDIFRKPLNRTQFVKAVRAHLK